MEGKIVRYRQPSIPVAARLDALTQRMGDVLDAIGDTERQVEETERRVEEMQRVFSGPVESDPVPRVYVEPPTVELVASNVGGSRMPPVAMEIAAAPRAPRKKKRLKSLTPRANEQLENLDAGAHPDTVAPHTLKAFRERGLVDAKHKLTQAGLDYLQARRGRRSNGEARAC